KYSDLTELGVARHRVGHADIRGASHDPGRDLIDGSADEVNFQGVGGIDPREKLWHPEIIGVRGAGNDRGLASWPPAFDAPDRQFDITQDAFGLVQKHLA